MILLCCPSCGCADVETVTLPRKIGEAQDGSPVMRAVACFACTSCEWIRTVAGEEYRRKR